MISQGIEEKNAKGIITKRLYIKQLELEYWELINEVKKNYNVKSTADALRFALKRATNRI